jgi:hypothetical protein
MWDKWGKSAGDKPCCRSEMMTMLRWQEELREYATPNLTRDDDAAAIRGWRGRDQV